jgi:putative transposase
MLLSLTHYYQKEIQAMAHCNTLFHSMLNFIPRHQFSALEYQHSTGRKSRKFSRWNQFVHLMFMQLTGRKSLRDGIQSMNSRLKDLYHIGARPVSRSTFADANNSRPASFYEALFERVYQRCRLISPKHKFKFKNKLYSLDASTIDLSLGAFPWASFRRTKSAVKIHTLLDHSGYLPAFVSITDGKTHETKVLKSINLPKGSIVVEDRAYTDYQWFNNLQQNGIFFVTRQKKNAVYRVTERRRVNKNQGLSSDQTIILTGTKGFLCPQPLRRIGYRDPETKIHYVFLTNNFKLSAKTIADIYKERWQIEIFFRWIKQNLRIKAFIGNSRNAVMTQIYVALIAYLLLCMFKFMSKVSASLQNLIRVVQLNLFRTCSLEELFEPPPKDSNKTIINNQLQLTFF